MYRKNMKFLGRPVPYLKDLNLLLAMKISILILIVSMVQVSASTFAQSLTITANKAPMAQVLKEIRKQSGYKFIIDGDLLKRLHPVSVSVKNASLEKALSASFSGQPVSYEIVEKTIFIKAKESSLFNVIQSAAKNLWKDLTVKGRVVDQDGKPLPNASIRVKGKSAVTNTNADGEFEIKGVDEDAVLLVSYVGFKTLEISLKDAVMPLEIKLNVATGELEEVNVTYSTGYQNIPKERATGSFVQIDKELFSRGVSTNVLDRILEVTNSLKIEKTPLVSSNITIRGLSTINASMKPLIVVDGFPYEEVGESTTRISLNNLNPNDIESITILRDAAAASIWGARSGNGVIVITTKKGKFNQNTNVSFQSSVNLVEKPRLDKMKVIDPMEAIEFEKKAFSVGSYNVYDDLYPSIDYFPALSPAVELMLAARKQHISTPGYNVLKDPEVLAQLAAMGGYDIRDDISKYLLQTAVNQQYSFNISGGSEKMKYYTSFGYDNNLPIEKGNQNDRVTLNFNSTFKPIKNLELNTFIVYTKRKNTAAFGVNYTSFLPNARGTVAPYSRLADNYGNSLPLARNIDYRVAYLDTASYPALLDWYYRPLDEMENSDNTTDLNSTRIGGGIKYNLLPGIAIAISSQYENVNSNNNNYSSIKSYGTRNTINRFMYKDASGKIQYPVPLGGILDFTNSESIDWNIRSTLTIDKKWAKHQISAIAGVEAKEISFYSNTERKYKFDRNTSTFSTNMDFKNSFAIRPAGHVGAFGTISSGESNSGILNRFMSYFANAGYTYNNKYTLTASGRIDGSNFFGSKANQRITPLWSSGILWDISNEDFYQLKWLSSLKLRATYGYNANMNNRATALPTAQYNNPTGTYNNEIYLTLLTPPNPGLTWERVKVVNLGVDFGILNNRINGTLEYYKKKGVNLIGAKIIESTVGVSTYSGNYGTMTGKGFDLILNSVNFDRKLKWATSLNLSYNTDKITNYEISQFNKNNTSNYFSPTFLVLNERRLKVYSYPAASLDPLAGQPRGYVNGQIVDFIQVIQPSSSGGANPSDLIYHGSATPEIFGNVLNTLNYKQISLSFNIGFQLKYFVRTTSINYASMLSGWGKAHSDYALRWRKPGDEDFTIVPSMPNSNDGRDDFYMNSNSLVVKGDHIRLRDIRLSYALNRSTIKRLPFTNANLFVYTSNLGILWKANKDGIDPDYPDNSVPPVQRSIAVGLNLNF
ncbi:SusC/RagA family TonB-linked outer membrane protein [Pedobacter heparinus]|uniref:SusC/RagA family TonB-linked outer membrane protein n=1 Tax=Pedobacter heparinus TaxID=984 RepID=UPI0029316671|nr:SusC/RagA family TonB-linked outer membrane protein [Pedobacter heparinus]